MVIIDDAGVRSLHPFADEAVDPRLCLFEFVYFARPDSRLYGQSMHQARIRMGEQLAEQAPVEADMVMGVPESGVPAAEGFARASGIPFGQGLVKNRYIGRSFIAPNQELRARAVRMKLNPLRENIRGKRLVVVDDSIVRGTTQHQLVRMLREAGAREVHLRITSPPVTWSCFYGIDTGDRSELIAHNLEVDAHPRVPQRRQPGLPDARPAGRRPPGAPGAGFCDACFTGDYPVEVPLTLRKHVLEDNSMPHRRGDRAAGARRHHRLMGETYSGAGVDIAAGEAAVDRIKGQVRSTYRPEVLGDIGGFGGLVTLPDGYRQPVLVSSTDGVGTKAMVATRGRPVRHDRHRPRGHVRRRHRLPGRRAAVLPRLHLGRRARPRPDRRARLRRGRGLPPGRVRAGRRRDGRAPRAPWSRASSTSSASWWAWPSATAS